MKRLAPTFAARLAEVRRDLAAAHERAAAVAAAAAPLAMALERLRALVDDAASAVETTPAIVLTTADWDPRAVSPSAFVTARTGDVFPLLCWLDKGAVLKRLETDVRQLYASSITSGLDLEARAAALEDAERELEALEREEERIIREAGAAGLVLDRRPDASLAIVLAAD